MDVECTKATYLSGREVVVLAVLMVLQDRVFPLLAWGIVIWAVVVLKWLAVYGILQMVLENIAAYGTVEMVLQSIAAYGNLHFAGPGVGLSVLATHVPLFCDTSCLGLRLCSCAVQVPSQLQSQGCTHCLLGT